MVPSVDAGGAVPIPIHAADGAGPVPAPGPFAAAGARKSQYGLVAIRIALTRTFFRSGTYFGASCTPVGDVTGI